MKALVTAGASSGSGKTTLSLGLMAAFRRRGLIVQPFKVGPDFIDPGHHAKAAGRISHNLDGWMLPSHVNQEIFTRYCEGADIAVIEGVMVIEHGWVERDGMVVDPTLPRDNMVYFAGLRFRGQTEIAEAMQIPKPPRTTDDFPIPDGPTTAAIRPAVPDRPNTSTRRSTSRSRP